MATLAAVAMLLGLLRWPSIHDALASRSAMANAERWTRARGSTR